MAKKRRRPDPWTWRIARLRAEIDDLVAWLHNTQSSESRLVYENLKTYKVEIMRDFVLYMQLAIDELLRSILFDFIRRQNRGLTKEKELVRVVKEMRAAEVVHWCGRLRLVKPRQYERLRDLNRIRNKCAHEWVLDIPRFRIVGRGNGRRRLREHVVLFENSNLLTSISRCRQRPRRRR